ncbi:hypothetical protein EV363DRAFT_1293195 [Boletus edulis]|nr:hypothetical protein EV363DRAFT_1293195 [Boletus edulis]
MSNESWVYPTLLLKGVSPTFFAFQPRFSGPFLSIVLATIKANLKDAVFRLTRSVALDCPTLWTYLFVTSPRWTEEFLARSKSTPLKVYVIMRELDSLSAALHFVEQVMDHVERIQELHVYVPDFQNVSGILHKLSSRRSSATSPDDLGLSAKHRGVPSYAESPAKP